MSDTVFILGAGASREGGGPLMDDFLNCARALHRDRKTGDATDDFERVFEAVAALDPVYAKASIDTNNIEDVFSAFEMGALFERLGNLPLERVRELSGAIRAVIVTTLEERLDFAVTGLGGDKKVRAPRPYPRFASLIAAMESKTENSVSVITFNYDLALDFALYRAGLSVDYCLPHSTAGRVPVMKLHGSLNWTECPQCGVVAWALGDYFSGHGWDDLSDKKSVRLTLARHLAQYKHCDAVGCTGAPAIVPPTWNKTAHQVELAPVWRRAAEHLAGARNIVVVGYSLPASDQFFRYLYALGSLGTTRIERFMVVDPDKRGTVKGPLSRSAWSTSDELL